MKNALMMSLCLISLSAWPAAAEEPGLFPAQEGGKFGYIDSRGRMAIKPEFDWAFGFSNGLALVNIGGIRNEMGFVIGGKWGYIDQRGRVVINPRYDDAKEFSEGLALVNLGGKPNELGLLSGGKRGYIDRKGELVIEAKYEDARSFSEGLALVRVDDR